MSPVKSRIGTEAGRRLDLFLQLLSEFEDMPLTYKQLAALLGGKATETAIKKWPLRGIPERWARRLVRLGAARGVDGLSVEWLVEGEGREPSRRARSVPMVRVVRETRAAQQLRPISPIPGKVLDMHEAAARIASSLNTALRKSEALIDASRPKELERQRALVWALKDLARQLKRCGYNMDELFDLTDEMAAELGLPPHPEHKEL